MKTAYPDDERCVEILKEEQTFPNIIDHCKQVQHVALTIFDALNKPHNVCPILAPLLFLFVSLLFFDDYVNSLIGILYDLVHYYMM